MLLRAPNRRARSQKISSWLTRRLTETIGATIDAAADLAAAVADLPSEAVHRGGDDQARTPTAADWADEGRRA